MFSFWALTLGSMTPDLEVIPIFLGIGDIYVARGPLHSVLGVLTWNALITVLAVRYVFPPVLRNLRKRWPDPSWLRFAGQDLREDPGRMVVLYTSAVIGGLTHVFVDLPTHIYNPLAWPWQTGSLQVLSFAIEPWWQAVTSLVWGGAFVAMMIPLLAVLTLFDPEERAQHRVHLHELLATDGLVQLDHDADR